MPAGFGIAGRAVLPPRPEVMPLTWRGTYGADRDYVTSCAARGGSAADGGAASGVGRR